MQIKGLTGDNRLRVTFTLFLVWLFAVWQLPVDRQVFGLLYPLLAIGVVTVIDLGITFVRDHKFYLPSASLVTGFLIGLIIAPTEKLWIIVAASLAASLSKQLIKAQVRGHIFNPAAFGIIFVNLAFGVSAAWWGVGWSKWPLLILIPLMIRILWSMKRLMLPATFLVVYFLFLTTQISPIEAIKTLADGSLVLFALVMLPEPITSPVRNQFKWFFGMLVAVLSIGLTQLGIINEVFLPALLIANLASFVSLRLNKTSPKTPKTENSQNSPEP